jgi:hypothetical protein
MLIGAPRQKGMVGIAVTAVAKTQFREVLACGAQTATAPQSALGSRPVRCAQGFALLALQIAVVRRSKLDPRHPWQVRRADDLAARCSLHRASEVR